MMKLPVLAANAMRSLMAIAMMMGGVVCTILSIGMVLVVWLGKWEIAQQGLQLTILGGSLAGFLVGMLMVLIALAVGGPLGRLKMKASRDGVDFEASDDETAKVEVKTTVTTTPAAAGETV